MKKLPEQSWLRKQVFSWQSCHIAIWYLETYWENTIVALSYCNNFHSRRSSTCSIFSAQVVSCNIYFVTAAGWASISFQKQKVLFLIYFSFKSCVAKFESSNIICHFQCNFVSHIWFIRHLLTKTKRNIPPWLSLDVKKTNVRLKNHFLWSRPLFKPWVKDFVLRPCSPPNESGHTEE